MFQNVWFRDIFEIAIPETDVGHRCVLVSSKRQSVCAPPACNIVELDIAYDGWVLTGITFFIIEVNRHDGLCNFSDSYVTPENPFDNAAANRIGLDAKRPIQPVA